MTDSATFTTPEASDEDLGDLLLANWRKGFKVIDTHQTHPYRGDQKMKSQFPVTVALISILAAGCGAENAKKEPKANETVLLVNSTGKQVFISNDPKSWIDKDLVARVENGTKARIKEIYKADITPEFKLMRFKVTTDNPTHTGWVHSFDAGYSTEPK